jgi:hypothetical protein
MIDNLIHFGCSFAMGNGVPTYVNGLKSGAFVHTGDLRQEFMSRYKIEPKQPKSCGSIIAKKLGLKFTKIAENGASNEMIFRKILKTKLQNSFVLVGFTSNNRREGLTTSKRSSHWHTWKMIAPGEVAKYKDLIFSPWKNEYKPAIEAEGQIRTLIQIIYMQNYFKSNNTPYLMFNALWNGFDLPLTKECDELLSKVDEKFFYKLRGTSQETQHGWCVERKLNVSDIDDHPNLEGQEAWANELLPHVKEILNAD